MGEKKDNLSGPIFHAQKSIQGEKYNKFALCVIPVRYKAGVHGSEQFL